MVFMSKIKIVTDSSVGLTEDEIKKYNITVIPLSVMIDDTLYIDNETITNDEFVEKMAKSEALPKTSQPSVGRFVEVFNQLGEDGSQVLSINMLEAISGTVHTAEQAATISSSDVTVIDSHTTDQGLGFQVLEAAKLAQAGADLDTIIKATEKVYENSKLYLSVMTLDNIVKGGRLNPIAGAITNFLNIKIALEVADGKIKILSKGRGIKSIKKTFAKVIDEMKAVPNLKRIGISYVSKTEFIDELIGKLKSEFPSTEFVIRVTSPIIATHTGEGAFALIFYGDDQK